MSDDRTKISLRKGGKRKGRSTINTKQISAPIRQDVGLPPGAPPIPTQPDPRRRPAPPGGGKTSDLVKRRYSTRFNNGQVPNFDPSVPPMPNVASFDRQPRGPGRDWAGDRDQSRGRADRDQSQDRRPPPSRGGGGGVPTIDMKALRDPKLNADQYVAEILGDVDEDGIRDFEATLGKLKARAAADLQQSVMQNRTQFIKISKEAEKLKGEMRTLRNLMSDLKANTTALRTATAGSGDAALDGEFSAGLSKRDKRSSVADRSALWNSQMQALFKNVEGSQKFLPSSSGRHVIQNAGPWIELDNATYRSRRAMQIFLLNDHLLIASRKKRKVDGPGAEARGPMSKLVADRCWPLLDIEIVDMAGSSDSSSTRNKLADAIMVRGMGQESFIYRTEKSEDPEKGALMLNLRKAVEELRKSLQSEMEANNKAKETINYFASRDPGLLQKTELLETLSDIKDMLIEVDGKQQNLRWVESQMDELDIDIALQNFEPAVARVGKLKGLARGLRSNVVAQDFINFKVEERCVRLAGLITRDLTATHNEQSKTKRNVEWLTTLGFEDSAREAYLAARSDTIQKRSRQCIFQGDLPRYIWEVSYVYFMIIRNTALCFQACFPPATMSACVAWAKAEVEAFNVILARQLSGTESSSEVWKQCMDQAHDHARLLSDVGLDFRNLVGREAKGEEPKAVGGLGLK
ncbi:probable Exocyst complex component EXO84 [Cephalotrichum gorgonifer]|uniref:Exocyst complex component EXO84 n=1 Tax=Cephalotrichum gorgonifer TaxID=2041049 RepID=A0AAE8SYH4_9PEZI|nr:probable Exocyst complex component EXO84 [Cephalotrichum gorgonifer]